MHTTIATSIRVFIHEDLPDASAVRAQANEFAAAHGLGIDFVGVDNDASEAIAAGIMALPAIVAYQGNTEIARRECAFAGRGTQRWFERKIARRSRPSAALAPTIA